MSRVLRRLAWFTTASAVGGAGAWKYYTKDTEIRALHTTPSSRAFSTLTTSLAAVNPSSNPPSLADHAIRRVPLSRLRTTDVRTLEREFCAGVWAGPGFKVQRRMLEKEGRALEGREDHLWEKGEFEGSGYEVGTRIADHFEVVDRGPNKIVVRCGDTPHNAGPRPSDGIFSMEVDKEDGYATFHMKTVFFNSTPEGATPAQLPWWLPFVHREYTKLWMETSVRRLMT